ncbi:hypothetical protein [Clostridium perfringens]|uniref:hypothetical protein n=1 Tax=Clostridium perfringens TaxID=1502 RepID=UPI0018E4417B|nr:hypothetical protein [Clostridium perfringens]MBI6053034.1 hypothetical protein [Clostridium perfringens]HAT4150251.1 hypothetical protein [Clostridium perfringens]
MDCKNCLLRENRRLIDELIKSKEHIKELEFKIMDLEERKSKEDIEDLFDSDVFRFK